MKMPCKMQCKKMRVLQPLSMHTQMLADVWVSVFATVDSGQQVVPKARERVPKAEASLPERETSAIEKACSNASWNLTAGIAAAKAIGEPNALREAVVPMQLQPIQPRP
jgi:hypothetical protein